MPTVRHGMHRINTGGFHGYSGGIQAHKRQRRLRKQTLAVRQASPAAGPSLRHLACAVWDAACTWARRVFRRAGAALGGEKV